MRVFIASFQDKTRFDEFVLSHPFGSIHQSQIWAEFQSRLPGREKCWPVIIEDADKVVGTALLIRHSLPFKKCWLSCLGGPLFKGNDSSLIFNQFISFVSKLAFQENAVFFRFEPLWPIEQGFPLPPQFRPAHAFYIPRFTIKIDLRPPEEQILAQMKQKGRYNVRLAERKGIEIWSTKGHDALVKGSDGKNAVESFYALLQITTQRDRFSAHPLSYYESLFEILGDQAQVFLARYQGELIAGVTIVYFHHTALYYFGASSNKFRNVKAPELVQWRVMQEAKKRGCTSYDLFGISPVNGSGEFDLSHPWAGITEFKLKFGGTIIQYAPAYELVFQPVWYFAMRMAKKIKKIG